MDTTWHTQCVCSYTAMGEMRTADLKIVQWVKNVDADADKTLTLKPILTLTLT